MDLKLYRRKTEMVFYALEKSIGERLIETIDAEAVPDHLVEIILDRERGRGSEISESDMSAIVAASYFQELVEISVASSKNLSISSAWREFSELCKQMEIGSVRNRLAHPNRAFEFSDWYRVGIVASSSLVDVLNISSVKSALISAEANSLTDPPDDWLRSFEFELPNNLPKTFDHELTGLVGRNKELKKLKDQIVKPRNSTLSIVAPGGSGKTALALDFLQSCSKTSSYSELFDGILFISLKLENQTVNGVERLSASETVEELRKEITFEYNDLFGMEFDKFEDILSVPEEEQKRIILCVDNLETLLRDHEDEFSEFSEDLPSRWKLLVTSRIDLTNSYILTLKALGEDASKHLARDYISKRGNDLSEDSISKLVRESSFNPLAIKLAVDYYIIGNELPKALSKVKKDIAEFSFKNLVDALSEISVSILELLFLKGDISRRDISQYLEVDVDESARGIAELTKTSLVLRDSNGDAELFSLNGSVRDFLLMNPRNLGVRKKLREKIDKNKDVLRSIASRQRDRNISEYSEYYIPSDCPDDLKLLLHRAVPKLLAKNISPDSLRNLYREFDESREIFREEFLYYRIFSIIYRKMGDPTDEKVHIEHALKLKSTDVASQILIAKHIHERRDYQKARDQYAQIMSHASQGLMNDEVIWRVVLNGYYLATLFLDRIDEILDVTKDWKKDRNFGDVHGAYRASAYRKRLESLSLSKDRVQINKSVNSCIKILDDVIGRVGYVNVVSRESLRAIDDVVSINKRRISVLDDEIKDLFLKFCNRHFNDLISASRRSVDERELIKGFRMFQVDDNPFYQKSWVEYANPAHNVGVSSDDIDQRSLHVVSVSYIPISEDGLRKSFIFAEDIAGDKFFIHVATLKNGSQHLWRKLRVGDNLAITFGVDSDKPSKPAKETYFVGDI